MAVGKKLHHCISKSGSCQVFLRLFQLKGSIFPRAIFIALPCGIISAVLKIGQSRGWFSAVNDLNLLTSAAAWTAFSALLGFLVVFRTSQAYTRFWAGCSATHAMRLDWFNACTMLMAYCRVSKAPPEEVNNFMGRLIRLISIMHAAALAELEEINVDTDNVLDIRAMRHGVLDPRGLDEESRRTIGSSTCKVELIFTWIQMLIVDSVDRGIISPPPPVLASVWNVFIKGMNSFGDALRISFIPFPFPYVQTCDMLLVLHWLMTPVVVLAWVDLYTWSGLLSFLQVFIVQALNLISVEIENPFGVDANDLDSGGMQEEMNGYLTLFARHDLRKIPSLNAEAVEEFDLHLREVQLPLLAAFDTLDVELAESDRKGRDFSRAQIRIKQRRNSISRASVRMSTRPHGAPKRTFKRAGTSTLQGRDADRPVRSVKPDGCAEQRVQEPQLQASSPLMPIQQISSTSVPPPPPSATSMLQPYPPERCAASLDGDSQGRAAQQGGPDIEQPEQPHNDANGCSKHFNLPRIGRPRRPTKTGDVLVMCAPEEDMVATASQATPGSQASAAQATNAQSTVEVHQWQSLDDVHSGQGGNRVQAQARQRPERSGTIISLGWDPPAPTTVSSPTTSGHYTSTGGEERQDTLVDLAAAGVSWRR
mmetsp:Transcript_120784/g.240581  ORF Transcript_120784/g.240581 Transcript_120784/m.240581 type:complete len:650 (+) Transcript_120784:60-2009(+)